MNILIQEKISDYVKEADERSKENSDMTYFPKMKEDSLILMKIQSFT